MKNIFKYQLTDFSRRNVFIASIAAFAVVIVGATLLLTRAAGFFVAADVSKAQLSGNASLVTNPDGTKALQFNAPVVTPPPTTPPPTGTLKGWQLTASNTGLAPHGLSCDTLPEYDGPVSNGNYKPAAGSVISGKKFSKSVNLSNGNITIEKSCFKGTSTVNNQGMVVTWEPDGCGNSCSPGRGEVTIRDSEFNGTAMSTQAVAHSCAFHGLGYLERNYIHNMGSGICFVNTGKVYSGSAIGNYVHKLRAYGDPTRDGSHNESGTIRDFPVESNPNRRLSIFNNRFDSKQTGDNDSGAFFIQTIYGTIDQATFEGNLFESGNYNLTLEAYNRDGDRIPYGRNMRANNNRFDGGYYGVSNVTTNGIVSYGWAEAVENYINDPTKPDNKGRAVSL